MLNNVLHAPRVFVVVFYSVVRAEFQVGILAPEKFRWKSSPARISSNLVYLALLSSLLMSVICMRNCSWFIRRISSSWIKHDSTPCCLETQNVPWRHTLDDVMADTFRYIDSYAAPFPSCIAWYFVAWLINAWFWGVFTIIYPPARTQRSVNFFVADLMNILSSEIDTFKTIKSSFCAQKRLSSVRTFLCCRIAHDGTVKRG